MVAVARVEDGEECVLPQCISGPDELPLAEVDALIRHHVFPDRFAPCAPFI
jgi:hypothetical protein